MKSAAVLLALVLALLGIHQALMWWDSSGRMQPPPLPTAPISGKGQSSGSTLVVGPKLAYKTIEEAVDAAKPGDTIIPVHGTYSGLWSDPRGHEKTRKAIIPLSQMAAQVGMSLSAEILK